MNRLTIIAVLAALLWGCAEADKNEVMDGYRGTWYEVGKKTEYGRLYSGGLGTFNGKHIPLAVYSDKAKKTFFTYGGIDDDKKLCCMVSYYDHRKQRVPKPVVVYRDTVNDPHINPVLCIDGQGYIWVFVSGRTKQPLGYKYRSRKPLNIDRFDLVSEEEFSYPQPWYVEGEGFIHLFGKNPGQWEVTFETSKDGLTWSEDTPIAAIRAEGDQRTGHYQISNQRKNLIGVMFQRHLNGNSNRRTDLYYMQTTNMGKTWQAADGQTLQIPVTRPDAPCRVADYVERGRNVYLKDLNYDSEGNPVLVYLTSGGSEPGPESGPYDLMMARWDGNDWVFSEIGKADHNYDNAALFTEGGEWTLVYQGIHSPYPYAVGGEITLKRSADKGVTWGVAERVTSGSTRNNGYVRRSAGGRAPFNYLWADGDPHAFSESAIWFGDLEGNTWKLPRQMEEDFVSLHEMEGLTDK